MFSDHLIKRLSSNNEITLFQTSQLSINNDLRTPIYVELYLLGSFTKVIFSDVKMVAMVVSAHV